MSSQIKAIKLQEKMNELAAEEWSEIMRITDQYGSDICNTILIGIRVVYNRKRQRAIWWYEHSFDVVVLAFILVVIAVFAWFFVW